MHNFDGIVLKQPVFDQEARQALNTLKSADKNQSLILISEGRKIACAEEVLERLKEGATLTTTCDPFYLKGGPCTVYDIKKGLVEHAMREGKVSSGAKQD